MVKKVDFDIKPFRKKRKDTKSVKPARKKGKPDFIERIKKLGK